MTHLRSLVVALVTAVVLVGTAAPASALELRDTSRLRPMTVGEVKWQVMDLLVNYVGPAVADSFSKPVASAWGCRTYGAGGKCWGKVAVGEVYCRGLFEVRRTTKTTAIYPIRMICAS